MAKAMGTPTMVQQQRRRLVASLMLGTLIVLLKCSSSSVMAQVIRINCGGGDYVGTDGREWMKDDYARGGNRFVTNKPIANTNDDPLLQSERFSPMSRDRLSYAIPIDNPGGFYDVRMQFSENYSQAQGPNLRLFHIVVEDVLVYRDMDIFAEAGNRGFSPAQKEFRVQAVGDFIDIDLIASKQNAKVNTIEILPSSTSDELHPDITAVLDVVGEPNPIGSRWADSYSANGNCYCDGVTTYDHDIASAHIETSIGWMTVQEACELIGPGPGRTADTPVYNTVQCGHGPPNNAGDEHTCPGRVDMGRRGCGMIGPKWNFSQ